MTETSPKLGGSGGKPFQFACPANNYINKISGRSGLMLDALRLTCDDGSQSTWFGGRGGSLWEDNSPGGFIGWGETRSSSLIDRIQLKKADGTLTPVHGASKGGVLAPAWSCPAGWKISSIVGRAGGLIDNLQFTCSNIQSGQNTQNTEQNTQQNTEQNTEQNTQNTYQNTEQSIPDPEPEYNQQTTFEQPVFSKLPPPPAPQPVQRVEPVAQVVVQNSEPTQYVQNNQNTQNTQNSEPTKYTQNTQNIQNTQPEPVNEDRTSIIWLFLFIFIVVICIAVGVFIMFGSLPISGNIL